MSICDQQEFLDGAAPLHQVLPPRSSAQWPRWQMLYARFPAEAFTRRLGWLPVDGERRDDGPDWRRWLRDRSWAGPGDGAESLARWAVDQLPASTAGFAAPVGEDLRRHLAGEIRAILSWIGGPEPSAAAAPTAVELSCSAARRPALARLLGLRLELWRDATSELLLRYHRDRARIVARLLDGRDPGPLVGLRGGLGDSHDGFRTVAGLRFASGDRIVYKPRDIEVEAAWFDLVRWINIEVGEPRLAAHRVLARRGYGWAEYVAVEHGPLDDADAVVWFRGGWLLAVLHALGASDCHSGNVVLTRGWPHVVDLETVLTPGHRLEALAEEGRPAAAVAAARRLRRSVLGASVLPAWAPGEGGELYLGSFEIPVEGPGRAGFRAGFSEGYRFLLDRRSQLVSRGGPLRRLASAELRIILRPTRIYAGVQRASLAAGGVTGMTRSLAFETLVAPLLDLADDSLAAAVAGAEIEALDAGDIPRFVVRGDSTDARCGGRPVPGLCSEPAWSAVCSRLSGLSPRALEEQEGLIDLALDVAAARAAPVPPGIATPGPTAESEIGVDELRQAATAIAEGLCRSAERGSDGSAAWVGLAFDPSAGAPAIVPTDAGLYSGNAGIAVFLAAAAKATGRDQFAELSVAALAPHPWQPETVAAAAFRALPVGGYVGLASILYGWATVGRLLDRRDLVDAAVERSRLLLTEQRIAADRRIDRVAGAAGAIPVLVGLYRQSGARSLLGGIRACGERLVGAATPAGGGLCWPDPSGVALCGMSHGAAGIALSLLQAWAATGDTAFRDAAGAGRHFEDGQFDHARANWPDRRGAAGAGAWGDTCSWCHGAPGIVLARTAMAELAPDAYCMPTRREDPVLAAALATAQHRRLAGGHLCCGEAGVADILFEIGCRARRPALIEAARARLGRLVAVWRTEGRFPLNPQAPKRAPVPGLMQGVSGVGLALLRASGADAPAVLLLDDSGGGSEKAAR